MMKTPAEFEAKIQPESSDSLEFSDEHKYEVLDSPELRARYLQLTDKLISEMVSQKTDVAIFLDKSARPVAWLVKELWDTLVPPGENGEPVLGLPQIKFLNIDREQWGAIVGRSEESAIDVSPIPQERINELQQVFAPINTAGNANEEEQSMLTGKNVMIVDEVKVSGDTGVMAEKIIKRAFPDAADIDQVYWMDGAVKVDSRSGVRVNTELPVWYSDKVTTGRLVGNRDTTKSSHSQSSRQRIGRFWLSTPFREPDERGIQLRKEASWLADDLQKHKMLYMPLGYWSQTTEGAKQRIERINGIDVEEYKKLRQHYPETNELLEAYSDYMKARSQQFDR